MLPLPNQKGHSLTIEGAGHYSFTNACELISTYPDCGEDHIAIEEAHHLINTTVTAFLQSVRGMEGMEDYMPYEDMALTWSRYVHSQGQIELPRPDPVCKLESMPLYSPRILCIRQIDTQGCL